MLNRRNSSKKDNLGEENDFYYNEERKKWMMRGQENNEETESALPPPPTSFGFAGASDIPGTSSNHAHLQNLDPNGPGLGPSPTHMSHTDHTSGSLGAHPPAVSVQGLDQSRQSVAFGGRSMSRAGSGSILAGPATTAASDSTRKVMDSGPPSGLLAGPPAAVNPLLQVRPGRYILTPCLVLLPKVIA